MKKIVSENDKYRIVKETVEPDDKNQTLCNDFYVGKSSYCRCRLSLGEAVAVLEKKKSVFVFWSDWEMIEMTNQADVVREWMTKYFTEQSYGMGRVVDSSNE